MRVDRDKQTPLGINSLLSKVYSPYHSVVASPPN
jgi:hypothetical protein